MIIVPFATYTRFEMPFPIRIGSVLLGGGPGTFGALARDVRISRQEMFAFARPVPDVIRVEARIGEIVCDEANWQTFLNRYMEVTRPAPLFFTLRSGIACLDHAVLTQIGPAVISRSRQDRLRLVTTRDVHLIGTNFRRGLALSDTAMV